VISRRTYDDVRSETKKEEEEEKRPDGKALIKFNIEKRDE